MRRAPVVPLSRPAASTVSSRQVDHSDTRSVPSERLSPPGEQCVRRPAGEAIDGDKRPGSNCPTLAPMLVCGYSDTTVRSSDCGRRKSLRATEMQSVTPSARLTQSGVLCRRSQQRGTQLGRERPHPTREKLALARSPTGSFTPQLRARCRYSRRAIARPGIGLSDRHRR